MIKINNIRKIKHTRDGWTDRGYNGFTFIINLTSDSAQFNKNLEVDASELLNPSKIQQLVLYNFGVNMRVDNLDWDCLLEKFLNDFEEQPLEKEYE